jgi:hypothetical protein
MHESQPALVEHTSGIKTTAISYNQGIVLIVSRKYFEKLKLRMSERNGENQI